MISYLTKQPMLLTFTIFIPAVRLLAVASEDLESLCFKFSYFYAPIILRRLSAKIESLLDFCAVIKMRLFAFDQCWRFSSIFVKVRLRRR